MSFIRASDSLSEDVWDCTAAFGRGASDNVATLVLELFSAPELMWSTITLEVYLAGSMLLALDKSRGFGVKMSSVGKEDTVVSPDSVPARAELRSE
jgi:hypothetical protein